MIKAENLTLGYGDKIIIDKLNLFIKNGECVAVMGPSGCGKSTLISAMLGLIKPIGGSITVDKTASAVFQDDRLCENFSALSNVRLAEPKSKRGAGEKLLCEMGLQNELLTPVRELSGGMRRRVAIARALVCDSSVLLMDEPFKGLDDAIKADVISIIKSCKADKTVVFVTHDIEEANALNAKIVTLDFYRND